MRKDFKWHRLFIEELRKQVEVESAMHPAAAVGVVSERNPYIKKHLHKLMGYEVKRRRMIFNYGNESPRGPSELERWLSPKPIEYEPDEYRAYYVSLLDPLFASAAAKACLTVKERDRWCELYLRSVKENTMDNEVRQMLDDMRNKEEWWKSTIRWIISFSALVLTARMIAEGALWMSDLDIYPFFFLVLATVYVVGMLFLMVTVFTYVDRFGREDKKDM